MLASTVNVSDFVSVKLASTVNAFHLPSEKHLERISYDVWKTQMLCLIESHNLLHIIHSISDIREDGDRMTKKYDMLVGGWILGTISDQMVFYFREDHSAQSMWKILEYLYSQSPPQTSDEEGTYSINYHALV
ncbi:hypothetical protein Hanom_Chr03g00190851 [Helianthus anomalus]